MKKRIAYILYACAALTVFLYVLFPSGKIREHLVSQAASLGPDVSMRMDDVALSLPPGLTLTNLEVLFRKRPVFVSPELRITPKYLSLFSGTRVFHIKGAAYEGTLKGRAALESQAPPNYLTDMNFQEIRVEKIEALSELKPHQLFGIADGHIRYAAGSGDFGEGNAEVTIKECRVELGSPVFGLRDLTVGTVSAVLELKGRQADVKEIRINGSQVTGSANGRISLRQPLSQSRLQIIGIIKPHSSFVKKLSKTLPSQLLSGVDFLEKGIPFRVTGSIGRPSFSLR